ncbi:hypothetical protein [Serratia fonticola]
MIFFLFILLLNKKAAEWQESGAGPREAGFGGDKNKAKHQQ